MPEETVDGVLVSRLFHFFTGGRIRESLRKIHSWLRPGGRIDPETQPLVMNLTDPAIMRRELVLAGFEVEVSSFFKYAAEPDFARLDGREITGAIGIKV